jgi:hypothetical protein
MRKSAIAGGLILGLIVLARPLHGQEHDPANINSRYIVESVELQPPKQPGLSRSLRQDLKKVIGVKLNQTLVDSLCERLKTETGARLVRQRLVRGSKPESLKLVFEIRPKHDTGFDLDVPKLTYYAKQGWSGAADGIITAGANRIAFGFVNDGDELMERFAGIRGSYERKGIAGRFGVRFDVADYRTQWNQTTLNAYAGLPGSMGSGGLAGNDDTPGIYRLRRVFQPVGAVQLWGPLTYTAGVSIQNLETQFPAARTEASSAVLQTLRFERRWIDSDFTQSLEAGYDLRAATKTLSSDFVYSRNAWDARYWLKSGSHMLLLRFAAGAIGGRAPLFERFVLGNSTSLRGWSKYDLTPLGATRMVTGTVEYRYRFVHVFYDTGSAWNQGEAATVRNSLGIGIHDKHGPYISVAFPLREGFITPILLLGLNF